MCTQLGLGHRFNVNDPVRVESLAHEHVVQVACGQQHTIALCENGHVYSWGLGVFGQLGHGTLRNERSPRLVEAACDKGNREGAVVSSCFCSIHSQNSVCCTVNAGAHFSAVIGARPLVWGHAEYGQHGGVANHEDWGGGVSEGSRGRREYHAHAVPRTPQAFENSSLALMACGSLHSVAYVTKEKVGKEGETREDGELVTWGW